MSWNMFSSDSADSMNARAAALNAESDAQEALIAAEIEALHNELASLRMGINYQEAYALAASELMDVLIQEATEIERQGASAIRLSDKGQARNIDRILAEATDVHLRENTGHSESLTDSEKETMSSNGRFFRSARRMV